MGLSYLGSRVILCQNVPERSGGSNCMQSRGSNAGEIGRTEVLFLVEASKLSPEVRRWTRK
jgi:hypothetical protein